MKPKAARKTKGADKGIFQSTPAVRILVLGVTGQFFLTQQDKPWTLFPGLLCLALSSALFVFHNLQAKNPSATGVSLSRKQEFLFLFLILGLGVLFRFYRLSDIPSGIARDEASEAVVALQMISGSWFPFLQLFHSSWANYSWADAYYYLSAWFRFVPATQFTFRFFFAFLSFASLGAFYWFFRRRGGPFTALLALFFISVAQWHVTLSRNGHTAILGLFLISLCLCLLDLGWEKKRIWPFALAAFLISLGFYGYPSFRIFPLWVLAVFGYEWAARPKERPFHWKAFFLLASILAALTAPLLLDMALRGDLNVGSESTSKFIGSRIIDEKSLLPILENLGGFALSFARKGDPTPTYNLPYHRLLDDGLGLFFVFGTALALFHWRERKNFYALAGLSVMALPALLSTGPTQCTRYLGTLPFIALLAASGLEVIWRWMGGISKPLAVVFLGLVLAVSCAQNYQTYFVERPKNLQCWDWADTPANLAGQAIAQNGASYDYYLSQGFWGNYSTIFQCFPEKDLLHPLKEPQEAAPSQPGKGLFFILEEYRSGVLGLLEALYPGGAEQSLKDPAGMTRLYFYSVPAPLLQGRPSPKNLLVGKGLRAEYYYLDNWKGKPLGKRLDFVLNFSSNDDLPMIGQPPLSVHWWGKIHAPLTGLYEFVVLTDDEAKASLAGNSFVAREEKRIQLQKGVYPFDLKYRKKMGFQADLHFLWKTPGSSRYEVVPFTALSP